MVKRFPPLFLFSLILHRPLYPKSSLSPDFQLLYTLTPRGSTLASPFTSPYTRRPRLELS